MVSNILINGINIFKNNYYNFKSHKKYIQSLNNNN